MTGQPTAKQLIKEVEALADLCQAQRRKIDRLKRENARLKEQLAAVSSPE